MPTHHKGTPREVLALNTFIKLTRATDSVMSRLFRRGTLEGITPTQFGVLETLHHLGPLCQGEISAKLLRSGGNTTLVIDNLEKLGLVRRDRDQDDRRLVRVSLTNDGTALISRIFPAHAKVITEEMNTLTAEEQLQLGVLCKKLGKGECQPEHKNPDGVK
ncbi:MAG: MarR family winged helix-turn-helix transcriptional regulator [Anaerolineales bacterium]